MNELLKRNMHQAVVLLGSNLGDKKSNLENAINQLDFSTGRILKKSSVYQTRAWGKEDQPAYYNQAVLIETALSPRSLLDSILKIEKESGRTRIEKWEPRIIDIDILFFDEEIIDDEDLKIPHPHLEKRKFALIPLKQISPGWIHPLLRKDVKTLIAECKDNLEVKILK